MPEDMTSCQLKQGIALQKQYMFHNNWALELRSQGPPTEVKIGKSGNDIVGVKKCLLGGPSWNHLNGLFGAFNSLP